MMHDVWWDVKPTLAGRIIDVVTAKTDTAQWREAALKAVNDTILLIVAVILTGYVCISRHGSNLVFHVDHASVCHWDGCLSSTSNYNTRE